MEQQAHLQQLLEQRNKIAEDIQNLSNAIAERREVFMKVQGVIEYLQQIGVTLPESAEEEVAPQESSEEVAE